MRKAFVFILLCGLAACREEVAQNTDPVELNAETLGHFCQMNLLEHPGPKAQVHLKGLPGTPLFFSQVRDAIAYARMPEQSHPILAIHVNDMARPGASWDEPGQGNWIAAGDAFYVLGSSRMGGMGAPEAVPFSSRAAAEQFAAAHGGQVMRLNDIPDAMVLTPGDAAADSGSEAEFQDRLRALNQPEEPAT
ncbi:MULTISPECIES: nitrous oxide reductase accessory protein NosL [Paracoccus]|uniref:NosL copper chaperone n=1 Tax=Paracoccus kondratievae TaxID=135740 RepID=A0AAD3P036_9RHOB|nr:MULTISPECIES: nitrous oxide reductase accessory protein NosL [Paracoccus]GLK64699.1 NosL copper chaperone [Paracoccus kondratievae]SMG23070.1 copper chaperone NosL [Paracoccus sp. J56]